MPLQGLFLMTLLLGKNYRGGKICSNQMKTSDCEKLGAVA